MSYDKFSRPFVQYGLPKVVMPENQFSKYMYYLMTGFWPSEQITEISNELSLIPAVIKCRRTGCYATKDLEIFVMLRRWHIADNWEGVSRDLCRQ